jgi:hypothetical protein
MSYKPEVVADHSGKFYDNGLAFGTKEEAEAYVSDLMSRWTAVRETRVVESQDPVNNLWVDGHLERIEVGQDRVQRDLDRKVSGADQS